MGMMTTNRDRTLAAGIWPDASGATGWMVIAAAMPFNPVVGKGCLGSHDSPSATAAADAACQLMAALDSQAICRM